MTFAPATNEVTRLRDDMTFGEQPFISRHRSLREKWR